MERYLDAECIAALGPLRQEVPGSTPFKTTYIFEEGVAAVRSLGRRHFISAAQWGDVATLRREHTHDISYIGGQGTQETAQSDGQIKYNFALHDGRHLKVAAIERTTTDRYLGYPRASGRLIDTDAHQTYDYVEQSVAKAQVAGMREALEKGETLHFGADNFLTLSKNNLTINKDKYSISGIALDFLPLEMPRTTQIRKMAQKTRVEGHVLLQTRGRYLGFKYKIPDHHIFNLEALKLIVTDMPFYRKER